MMKMKLQKLFAYEYNKKKHYKHVVVVPAGAVEKLGWQHGQELEQRVDGDKLVLSAESGNKSTVNEPRSNATREADSQPIRRSSTQGRR